jgi:hypothetical protein
MRAVLVLIVTALAELAVVALVQQPLRWVGVIAGSLPVTLFFFVAMPLLRRERGRPS